MKNFNRLIISGRLGRDAELRYISSGDSICTFSICNSDSWKDRDGNKQEKLMWVNCNVWGKSAETLSKLLKKGMGVIVEGSLVVREWNDKDGNKRLSVECKVGLGNNVEITSWPKHETGQSDAFANERPFHDNNLPELPIEDSDLPF